MSESIDLPLRYLWAKTASESSPGWHPLVLHLLDVAASADAILELEPESTRISMGTVLGLSWVEARPWILFVIACHDLGKACPGFQSKWPYTLAETKLSVPRGVNTRVRHDYIGEVALSNILIEQREWPEDLADLTADAVGSHHGARASERAYQDAKLAIGRDSDAVGREWGNVRRKIAESLLRVFHPENVPTKTTLNGPDFMLLAGLTSFADWIGSNEAYFKFGSPCDCDDLDGWFEVRRRVASDALAKIGWGPRLPLCAAEPVLEEVLGRVPRPLQRAVAEALRSLDEPVVLLVEAPMGEGKTEAALFAHLELQRRFGHRGLYVALPSRATGNAMFSRVREFLARLGCERALDLQLLHGASLINDEFQGLQRARIDDSNLHGAVRAAEWFSRKKRALLSEYGVGTIDQALMTILPVRHNFVRIWGLANRVVVLDEIHAYDAYTGTLLRHLVSWLSALKSSVILLSATLPPTVRRDMAKAVNSRLPAREALYPRLTVFHRDSDAIQYGFEPDPDRRLTIQLRGISADVGEMRAALEKSLALGGMGLALVNTVQRAQDLYRQFPEGTPLFERGSRVGKQLAEGTTLLLFHARFPADMRQRREELAVSTFGPNGCREGRCILIATQVAEQSLDLDFDAMATDLAPIDLILQRAGRLWRHRRTGRPTSHPVLLLAGVDRESPPSFGRPLWWGEVYRADVLLRTWVLLRGRETLTLPDDIDSLVDAVYEETVEISEHLRERLDKAIERGEGTSFAHRAQAHMAVIGLPDDASWNDANRYVLYDDDHPEVHRTLMAQTRLGRDSVVVIPIFPEDEFVAEHVPDATAARQLFLRAVALSRKDVVDRLRRLGVPFGWQESPLLRNTFPLVLGRDCRSVAIPYVRLDDELGLVYESREEE